MFNTPSWAAAIDTKMANGVAGDVSTPRLRPYRQAHEAAYPGGVPYELLVAEHCRNIQVSESLYPILHLLEVVIRNRIHSVFSAHFGAADWYSQPWVGRKENERVKAAIDELKQLGKTPNPDDVVAKLTFGFWCSLFDARYEPPDKGKGPWPTLLKSLLPKAPPGARNRKLLLSSLESAREIRNRVSHHEPVLYLTGMGTRYKEMRDLLRWFSPEAERHLVTFSRFPQTFAQQLGRSPAEEVEEQPA